MANQARPRALQTAMRVRDGGLSRRRAQSEYPQSAKGAPFCVPK